MTDGPSTPRYVIVSPVKNEQGYVGLTLRSVAEQTLKPVLWVIVDDGSTDDTPQIVGRYASSHSFIRHVVDRHSRGPRQPGSGVIHAFNRGLAVLDDVSYDFIVKLDCDLRFEPDYFETLLKRLLEDERLGIVSGVYSERNRSGAWIPVTMPSYHACGASKVVRRACFTDIGGFVAAKGWDTVDEIRAWNKGWKTRHFRDLELEHHKREGAGVGLVRTSVMHGHIYYVTGGDPLFLMFKVLHRVTASPLVVNAVALLWGYLGALAMQRSRLVTVPEMRRYRKLLRERLRASMKRPFALRAVASKP
jgi:glycosyltransferase involved in cell wall biosynthesis